MELVPTAFILCWLGKSPAVHNMSSPAKSAEGSSPGQGGDKPRLTEEEKKQNHIASGAQALGMLTSSYMADTASFPLEQKRRQAIREGFDRLTELVPGLEGQGRSEGVVLQKTVAFMREQLEERRSLIQTIERNGGHVADEYKQ